MSLFVLLRLYHIPTSQSSLTTRHASERANIRFGKEFTTAVEQKQIAQQDAERAKFVVEKAEQERQAAVIRAEGEAEAANTISKALNRAGDAFVQFRKIEAAREIGMFPPLYYLLNSSFVSSSFSIHLLICLDHAFIKTCLSPHLHFYHD